MCGGCCRYTGGEIYFEGKSVRRHTCQVDDYDLRDGVLAKLRPVIIGKNFKKKLYISRELYSERLIRMALQSKLPPDEVGALLSANPCIHIADVERNPLIKWDFKALSANPSVTLQYVLEHRQYDWCFCLLSMNPNITMRDVADHPEIGWCDCLLPMNPNITMRDVVDHPEMSWACNTLSLNVNITPADFEEHKNIRIYWIVDYLCENANFTIDDIFKIAPTPEPRAISKNPNITIHDIKKRRYLDLATVARCANITISDVRKNKNIAWKKKDLNMNPNIFQRFGAKNAFCGNNPNMNPYLIRRTCKSVPDKIIKSLLANRFIWHSERVYEHIAARIAMQQKRFVEDMGQLFGRDLAGVIARYIAL